VELGIVLTWVLAFAVLTAAGAPLATLPFAHLPRRGAAFALPTALVPFAVVVFWVGQVTFGVHTVVVGALVVVAAGVLAHRRGARPNWRAVAGAYGLFAAAFVAFAVVRAASPGVTPAGGEQFLHYGLVKALLAADALPPEDFWFAGEPLRYYYGTQMQVAAFTALTGTPPRYGFNLGIAAFYGLLVVTAYGLGAAVVSAAGRSYRLGGGLSVLFVAVGGATTTAIRLLVPHLPAGIRDAVARPAFGFVAQRFEGGNLDAAVASQGHVSEWSWWYTRYVVPDTLQEFPLYSFVKADLHGHALSNGYVLFAAALAFAYYRTPADERRRRLGLCLGGLGGVAGLFGFMNTWSVPTVAGLTWLAVAAGPHPATLLGDRGDAVRPDVVDDAPTMRRFAAEGWRVVLAAGVAAAVVAVGVVVASPFLVFGSVPTNEGVGLFPPRSPAGPFLVVYGGALSLFAGALAYRVWPALREDRPAAPTAALLVVLVGLVAIAASFPVLAVTLPLLAGAWWLVRTDRMGFEGVLLVAGVGLLLAMDLVYAKVWPPTQVRWNTTLKVAVQAWTLVAAAAGTVGAIALADTGEAVRARWPERDAGDRTPTTDGGCTRGTLSAVAVGVLVVAVVLASLPFPLLIVHTSVAPAVESDESLTVDGMAVHERGSAEELEAIRWLDRQSGPPTIVEAPGHSTYGWTNPASTLSSANAVVGWDHQRGYRGNAAFECRAERADAVYAGPVADRAAVLRTYAVDYVYVGSNEREAYGDELGSFDGPAFEVAFQNDAATVYAVDRSELPDRELLRPCPRT